MMADAQGEMVGRSLGHPALEEGADVRLEDAMGVGVACRWDGASFRDASAMTNLNPPRAVCPIDSMVIGPSLI